MSYRREPQEVEELQKYRAFCRDNAALIEKVGLPSFVVEDYNTFLYFLIHNSTFPHPLMEYSVERRSGEQRKIYLLLLEKYFEAGCLDPGVFLTEAERREFEQKYPRQFPMREADD